MNAVTVPSVDVVQWAALREGADAPFLLDVREEAEANAEAMGADLLIPLAQLPARMNEVPRDRPVVVHCKAGGRSARAVQFLMGNGYDNVQNLAGGIDAWKARLA
jgi:rhodanese-related sulfurtransferase